MISNGIHHVLVTEEGLPKAVLSSHDLILLQGKSPLTVSRHLAQQKSVEGLAGAQKKIMELLPLLLREGARMSHITRIVSEINDRLMAKVLEFAEAELGPPPLPYCWVVLGSEGRREQTFKTDQDNALIYQDPDERAQRRNRTGIFRALFALRPECAGQLWLLALHRGLHGQQSALAAARFCMEELFSNLDNRG